MASLVGQPAKTPKLVILISLTVAAFVSRFYGIWLWDLVGDENFTAVFAHERYKSFINPAYYSLVMAFYNIFGDDYWISRLPALIMSIISIPTLYFFWSRVIGRNAALFAACILIFSAWHLWYSQFARHYMGVFLFASLAYYFFIAALTRDRTSDLVWALVFSLISMLFHATAAWVPASSAIAYIAVFLLHRDSTKFSQRIVKLYLGICILAALAVTPVLINILNIWTIQGDTWGYGAILIVPQLVKYIQIPLVISGFFGWLLLIKQKSVLATFLTFTIGTPILFLVIATPFMAISPAYAYYILPLIIILSGVACEEVRKNTSSSSIPLSFLAFVLILFSLLPSFASHYLEKTSLNFNSAVQFLEENYLQGDNMLVFPPGFHNKTSKQYETLPYIGFDRDSSKNWKAALDPILKSGNRTWIVTSSKRQPLAPRLENWLLCNARLVWQEQAKRIDYEVSGYQIFLVTHHIDKSFNTTNCQ